MASGRGLATAFKTALGGQVVYPAFFFQFDFEDSSGYYWTGERNIGWNGQTWIGGGLIGSVEFTGDGAEIKSRKQTFTLNGVDPTFYALMVSTKYKGRPAYSWLNAMNSGFTAVQYSHQIEETRMDELSIVEQGETISLILTCENYLIDLFNPNRVYHNNSSHHAVYPDDDFYQFKPKLAGKELPWGLPFD
jgi:hypothetical protein